MHHYQEGKDSLPVGDLYHKSFLADKYMIHKIKPSKFLLLGVKILCNHSQTLQNPISLRKIKHEVYAYIFCKQRGVNFNLCLQ